MDILFNTFSSIFILEEHLSHSPPYLSMAVFGIGKIEIMIIREYSMFQIRKLMSYNSLIGILITSLSLLQLISLCFYGMHLLKIGMCTVNMRVIFLCLISTEIIFNSKIMQ